MMMPAINCQIKSVWKPSGSVVFIVYGLGIQTLSESYSQIKIRDLGESEVLQTSFFPQIINGIRPAVPSIGHFPS